MSGVSAEAGAQIDLVGEIRRVLERSTEPLTIAKIRAALGPPVTPEALAEALDRQVAANVLVSYPRYRSQHERYWDRPMAVHIGHLLEATLRQGPATWSEIRKRLPVYARRPAEALLEEQVAQAKLFRHPPAGSRGGPRYGREPHDPRPYLQAEYAALMSRCEQLGLERPLVRAALLELIRAEEWSPGAAGSPPQRYAVEYHHVRLPGPRFNPEIATRS